MPRFFALLFLFLAISTVVLGVGSTGASRHSSMVVLAVPGLDRDLVAEMAAAGELPVLGTHLQGGLEASITPSAQTGGADFWERALTGGWPTLGVAGSELGPAAVSAAGLPAQGFWRTLPSESVALVGFPRAPSVSSEPIGVGFYPGSDVVDGFVGGSEGRLFVRKRLVQGLFEWPYSHAASLASEAVADLEVGAWTSWLPLTLGEDRHGVFRLYRSGPSSVYATPIYRTDKIGASAPAVLSDPSVGSVTESKDLAEVLFAQSRTGAEGRFAATEEFARSDRRLVVHFETLARFARQLDEAAGEPSGRPLERRAYVEIDQAIGRILESATAETLLVLVGLHRTGGEAATPWLLASHRGGRRVRTSIEVSDVAVTLAYLAGGADVSGFQGTVSATVRGAFQPLALVPARAGQREASVTRIKAHALAPDVMDELGLLSAVAANPESDEPDPSDSSSH